MSQPRRKLPSGISALFADARIFKAGNSLAIRIPRAVAKRLDFEDGAELEMVVDHDALWVRRNKTQLPKLRDLLDRITPENLHGEISTGRAVGREVIED